MTLLSPLALLFGLSALVPLILHLYQRRRRTVLLFSTNRFFTQSVLRSQRRLRLRRLLLLLLRVSACVLLAFALSRPILRLAGFGAGRPGNRDIVVLLDDSLSMQATDALGAPGQTHFAAARQLTAQILGSLSSGDRAAVVTFTGKVLAADTRTGAKLAADIAPLSARAAQLQATSAAGDLRVALARAAELFKGAEQRSRSLLVLSDLQATDWPQSGWPQPDHAVGMALLKLAPPTQDNVAADQMALAQTAAVAGQPNLLRVRLVNYRADPAKVQLVLRLDDREVVRRPVDLAGRAAQVERVPIVFDKPGEHRVVLTAECPDALPTDNVLYAAVAVSPHLPVLLVDGGARAAQEKSAAFYLRAAMAACGTSQDAQHEDSISADLIRPEELSSAALERYAVVLLSDVRELGLPALQKLEAFVRAGGGLAIFLGGRCDPKFYNDLMGGTGRPLGGLLPAELRSRVGGDAGAEPMHVLQADLEHPVLQRFKGPLRGALAGLNILQAYAVAPREGLVLASVENQLPLIVERAYGRGKVLLLATSPQPRWSNLPLRRTFIPLVSQMLSYLAGSGVADSPHEAGRELLALRGLGELESAVEVQRPDGSHVRAAVRVSGGEPVAYLPGEQVEQPGFYRVLSGTLVRAAALAGGSAREELAVNAPRSESVPAVLDTAAAAKAAGRWQVKVVELSADTVHGPVNVPKLLEEGSASRGIWDALLWLVLILLMFEPLVANRMGARREES